MSHELRTPLNGILGYTQIFKRDHSLTDKQHAAIEVMHHSGEHLLAMINDILDLSKIEAEKMELEPTEFHLPQFLRSLRDITKIRAEQKGIAFEIDLASDLPQGVYGDEKRLRQVLLNLLGNAIKFTQKGRIIFQVECHHSPDPLKKRDEKNDEQKIIRFTVTDTGPGMPAEQFDEIFLPFHQTGEKLIQADGAGLGLAISQRLVRMMGGEMYVESTVGQGSRFWLDIELPGVTGIFPPAGSQKRQEILGFKGETLCVR